MGRQAYLVRMALGRSAYEPISPIEGSPIPSSDPSLPYQQHYDRKGNPINPETVRQTEALIAAKNEVLAAVGVCEKKNADVDGGETEDREKPRVRFSDDEWAVIREQENDYGELIRMFAECGRNAVGWWIVGLRRRVQIGLISSDLEFVQILSHEWASFSRHGLRGAITYLAAGGLPEVSAQLFLTFYDWFLGEQVLELSKKVLKLKTSSRKRFMLLKCLSYGYRGLNALLTLLVYPMTAFSSLQQLGLISASPLTTPRIWMLPWHPSSPLRWSLLQRQDLRPQSSRLTALLFSPATLWLAATMLQNVSAAAYGHVPLCEQDAILNPHNQSTVPSPTLFAPLSGLRDRVLRCLGWAPDHDSEDLHHAKQAKSSKNRVTELSMLPAHFLALNLDNFFWTLLLLPFDGLHLCSLATAFQASVAAQMYVGHGPNVGVVPAVGAVGTRASKVGLCLALQFVVDTAVWGGAYAWTRWAGTTRFHWGST